MILLLALSTTTINAQETNKLSTINDIIYAIDNLTSNAKSRNSVDVDELLNEINTIKVAADQLAQQTDVDKELLADKVDELDLYMASIDEYPQSRATTWRYGDILYYGIGANNAAGESSFTGHTAVMSTTPSYVIEASKTANNGAKVHHWNVSNLWKGASEIKQYYVHQYGKSSNVATAAQRKNAVIFGINRVGEPYKLTSGLWANDGWYCSKLTYRQWYSAGINLLEPHPDDPDRLPTECLPYHVRLSAATSLKKDWGSTLPKAF